MQEIIEQIRELHRLRVDWHRAEKTLTLQAKAICRRACHALSNGEEEREKRLESVRAEADKLFSAIVKGSEHPLMFAVGKWIEPHLSCMDDFARRRKEIEKRLERLAKQLPVAPWVTRTKGAGLLSLAQIVGEAGDLSSYSNPGKLWKRFGLAPINGKAASTWRREGGLSAEDWKQVGYSPDRRSILWNVGACLFKAQSARVDKETGEIGIPPGPYRDLYDQRKEMELTRVETKMHAHNRALRYVEKRFLRELWVAWRDAPSMDQRKAA